MEEGDPALLLGLGVTTPGVMGPVLDPDSRKTQTYYRESSEESLRSLRDWSISPMRKCRES